MSKAVNSRAKTIRASSKNSVQEEFFTDLSVKDMLYAAIIRSPIKKGIVTAVSHPDLPDGYSIITARDVPGSNLIDVSKEKISLFSEGNISYLGEPLGILVGPDEATVYSLCKEIHISFDENPIEEYIEQSSEKKVSEALDTFFSPNLAERNIEHGPCFSGKNKEHGIQGIFEQASHIIENSWTYSLNTPDYREPNGAICFFKGNTINVYTPTQWPSALRTMLSAVLHIKTEDIVIKKTRAHTCTSSTVWYNSIIASQVAVASYCTGHPVKLVYSRDEQECFMNATQPVTIVHKTAVDSDGKIVGMQINIDFDAGFANPFAQEIIDRLAIASCGPYAAQNISIKAMAYKSARAASSIDLRLIDSAAFFAIENQMNAISQKLKLSPIEMRKINLAPQEKRSRIMPFHFDLDKNQLVLDTLYSLADFGRRHSAYTLSYSLREANKENLLHSATMTTPLRGIGISCAFEGTCYFGSHLFNASEQSIELTMENENVVHVHCPPLSASVQEVWTKLASSIIGISPSGVKINSALDADKEPPLPESIYSNISVMTELLKKGAESIKEKRYLGKLPCTVKKTISASQKKVWNQELFSGRPFYSTSFAAASVELEFDPCTFREKIRSIVIVIDGGKILNATAAEKAAKLAVQRVLKSLVDNENIECLNITIHFVPSEESPAQIGELVYHVLPAAYTQALSQASGCTINSLPLQTDSVYHYLVAKADVRIANDDAGIQNDKTAQKQEIQNEPNAGENEK